ncbi:S-layer homology domain-containing protein [Cohnella hashimotonis]|uniref:S-layer homology domain-containing protein n=1 Tax=Cohnella hashimotonis TaxID=2826895 RepID=A0ABT6TR33_9BACL|nr:S-layer homology domain-containing protein [Cohnella hashimotonis]MDI4648991.1 S-layer homology domain-containing protein [Cohnella hashimotonis]
MKLSVKRITSILLAVAMLLTGWSSLASAAVFKDTQGHWAQGAVEKWSEAGVIQGANGTFRPNESVTRAEFATMIDNIVKYTETGDNLFSDLSSSKWYYDAILKLSKAGVLSGSNGKALPGAVITRQEAAVMVAKAFNIAESEAGATFTDEGAIAGWANGYVHALAAKKIIGGMPDGSFKPTASLTRAQAVTMFANFMQDLVSKEGDYSKDVQGNLVVNTPGAVLKDMAISGDLYITQGVGEGEVTLNNVSITGSVYVRGGGEHSIIFNSVDVKGALVVNKNNGKIRILATGSTSVAVTRLESGGLLVTKELTGGGFETVEITADIAAGQEIVLDGTFNKVVNQSADAKITANGTIKDLVAQVQTKLTGKVEIAKVTAAEGIKTTVNDQVVQPTGNAGSNTGSTGGNTNPGSGTNNPGPDEATGAVTLSLSKFDASNAEAYDKLDSVVAANSAALDIGQFERSVLRSAYYEAVVAAQGELSETTDPAGHYFNLVATLKDEKGVPLSDVSNVKVTVSSATYSYEPAFGADLSAGAKAGSVVLKLDAGAEPSIQPYSATFKRNGETLLTLAITLVPQGKSYIKRIGAISGDAEVGSTLIAGQVTYEGEGAVGPNRYQWYISNAANGVYTAIADATGENYTPKQADLGQYLRVEARADQNVFAGSSVSAAFGPIRTAQSPQQPSFIDPYFAADYPQAYVKNGEVWVKYKLTKPAEVYMVLNFANGYFKSDVKSVLEGHAGENEVIWVEGWPYFRVRADQVGQELEFNTHLPLSNSEARIEFVIKDESAGYVSSDVTTIHFESQVGEAIDTYPPYASAPFINEDLSEIYLYYYEKLDTASVPAANDFALNYGSIDRVSMTNYESMFLFPSSYIKLEVSGIPEALKNELVLSYSGTAIRDASDAKNPAGKFSGSEVETVAYESDGALISADRKSVRLSVSKGWNQNANGTEYIDLTDRFTVRIGGHSYQPNSFGMSYNEDYASYTLLFNEPLPAGPATAVFDSAGLIGVAYDPYPAEIVFPEIEEVSAPGTPTATYANGQIKLTFAEGFRTYNSMATAAGLELDVDGTAYALRGFIVSPALESNVYLVNLNSDYDVRAKNAIAQGHLIRIKFTNQYEKAMYTSAMADIAGNSIPDFDYIPVSKQQ